MVKKDYEILSFINFIQLDKWDNKRFSTKKLSSKYKIQQLKNHLTEESKKVKLFNFPDKSFGILGISNVIGMFDAYKELGENINQPYKLVKDGFLAYNPYRINVGSIGLKTNSLLDGDKLGKLMIEHNFGVSIKKVFEIKAIDTDIFNDYLES